MEEILASIRRIIEESDDGRKADEASGMPTGFANDERPYVDVEAGRAEVRPVAMAAVESAPARAEMPVRRPEAVERKPVALAEVKPAPAAPQPRMSTPVPGPMVGPVASPVVRSPVEAASRPAAQVESQIGGDAHRDVAPVAREMPAPVRPVAAPVEKLSEPDAIEENAVPAAAASHVAATQPKPVAPQIVTALASAGPSIGGSAVAPAQNSFLSSGAERKVQAAFGELSEAFVQRSHVVFDDMAREMMRPLLQEWLDNNLPVIVERLVREEIERVARGV
jgi:cell pole-organizing protein PopZ